MAQLATDLCLVADVAADLGVANDGVVQRVVTAASAVVASYLDRELHSAAVTERLRGYGRPLVLLSRRPVTAVASISCQGVALSSSDWALDDADAGTVLRLGGAVWPQTGYVRAGLTERWPLAISIADPTGLVASYTGGWVTPGQNSLDNQKVVTLPADIQEAAIIIARHLYRARSRDEAVQAESLGDLSFTYRASSDAIPEPARALLDRYRTVHMGA